MHPFDKPPCIVLFSGGTDWAALGRRSTEGDVMAPQRLMSFPKRIKIVASGPTACHSVCIDVDGGVSGNLLCPCMLFGVWIFFFVRARLLCSEIAQPVGDVKNNVGFSVALPMYSTSNCNILNLRAFELDLVYT